MLDFATIVLLASVSLYVTGVVVCVVHVRRHRGVAEPVEWPAISLIKPLAGEEDELDKNIASLLEQDYPGKKEVIFSSFDPADPGLAVAKEVSNAYECVPCRFAIADESYGPNPAVANIAAALKHASHELIFHSDGNTRLPPGGLRALVGEFLQYRCSILTCPVIGAGEQNTWAAVENVQLTTFTAPAMCFTSQLLRHTCVVGKSMMFRKADLGMIGGFSVVRNVLASDYFLGYYFMRAGGRAVLASIPIINVNVRRTAKAFWNRHLRWLRMRILVRPDGWLLDLLANPVLWAGLRWAWTGFQTESALVAGIVWACKCGADQWTMYKLRGTPTEIPWALPIRDLVMPIIAIQALFVHRVSWRGRPFRVGWGSRLRQV